MRRIAILTLLGLLGCATALAQTSAPTQAAGEAATRPPSAEIDTSDYRLGPEDVIRVFVWKEPDLSATVMVRPDGKVSLPLVNEIQAADRTAAEIRDLVAEALGRYIDNPVVSVYIEEINHPKVSVLGEVRLPGRYLMRQQLTILDAVALAGGFTEFAKRDKVAIVRSGPDGVTRIQVDLDGVIDGRSKHLPELRANDTVYVQ